MAVSLPLAGAPLGAPQPAGMSANRTPQHKLIIAIAVLRCEPCMNFILFLHFYPRAQPLMRGWKLRRAADDRAMP